MQNDSSVDSSSELTSKPTKSAGLAEDMPLQNSRQSWDDLILADDRTSIRSYSFFWESKQCPFPTYPGGGDGVGTRDIVGNSETEGFDVGARDIVGESERGGFKDGTEV